VRPGKTSSLAAAVDPRQQDQGIGLLPPPSRETTSSAFYCLGSAHPCTSAKLALKQQSVDAADRLVADEQYLGSLRTWRQACEMRPLLAYRIASISVSPKSTGPNLFAP
jgi:hypothetical protein